MVPNTASSPLGAITQRLASTPTQQLPHIVPFLATTLKSCQIILSASNNAHTRSDGSDTAVLVHKYKTQLSTLLQDKSAAGRWSAIVLIKATIELGGWETLQGAGVWVRGLLGVLGKPDPPATKKLCILTLTRIFLLTQGQQSLTRELTTPSLPTLVTTCLNNVTARALTQDIRTLDVHNPLLDIVLQMLITLLPQHPSLFRPFVNQIKQLLAPLLAPAPSCLALNGNTAESPCFPSSSLVALAQRLYALLSYCAPKNTSSGEWTRAVRLILYQIHRTADHVFRAVIEDWISSDRAQSHADPRAYGQLLSDHCDDDLELPMWRGIYSGSERIVGLLQLLQAHVATASSSSLTIPVGSIWSVLDRIMSIIAPFKTNRNDYEIQPRLNPEISRDEREGLWLSLPRLHVSAIELMSLLTRRIGLGSVAFAQGLLDRLLWVFRSSASEHDVRRSIYENVSQVAEMIGPSTSLSVARSMASLIRACCDDLLPSVKVQIKAPQPSTNGAKKTIGNGSSYDADSYLHAAGTEAEIPIALTNLHHAAKTLLLVLLTRLPSDFISKPLRSQMDRVAVLTQDKELMQASVLSPPSRQAKKIEMSILPLFAQAYPDSPEIEAILRPRMPVLQRRRNENGEVESDEDDDLLIRDALQGTATAIFEPQEPFRQSEIASQNQNTMNQPYRVAQTIISDVRESRGDAESPASSLPEKRLPGPSSVRDPGKRARDLDNVEDTTPALNMDSMEPPVVNPTTPATKRARLDEEVNIPPIAGVNITQAGVPISTVEDMPFSSTIRDLAGSESVATSALTIGGSRQGAADESDDSFEIPPLDPSLDTDGEYDDDEVEII